MAQIRSKQIADFLASVNWSNVSANDIANAADIKDYVDSTQAALGSDLNDSVDSLELALATEITTTNTEVTGLNASVDSLEVAMDALESKHDSEMTVHHDEHLSLIAAEESRATGAEGELADSVDSLEVALSTEIEATNSEVIRIDGRIDAERDRIDAILSSSDVDLDQFVEVVSYIDGLDLENDNIFISREVVVTGRLNSLDASVDSLEQVAAGNLSDINASVDSLEVAMDALESKHDSEMTAHHDEHLSLIAAEEGRAIEQEGFLGESIDSLETALSTEIEATNSDVTRIDAAVLAERGRAIEQEGFLGESIDSLETALSAEIEATNADVAGINDSIDSLELVASGNLADLNASVDSLEVALSTEIEATNADVDAINSDIASLESKHDSEMTAHHEEHLSLIAAEESRAIEQEGFLADSVDSLEVALSTEIEATNSEVIRIDGRITSEMKVERDRIDNILSAADLDLDQFVEVVSYVDALDLENDNIFIAYQGATDDSIDSLELALENGSGALVDSVDSLEVALSLEIETTNTEVNALNASVDSLEVALSAEIEATNNDFVNANASIDSLEVALSAEIEATNADFLVVNASIDSLETALAAESAAREFGDTYVEATVTGLDAVAGTVPVNTPTAFAMGAFDTEVYVNGLRVDFAQDAENDFRISVNYNIEPTDVIRIVGVQA